MSMTIAYQYLTTREDCRPIYRATVSIGGRNVGVLTVDNHELDELGRSAVSVTRTDPPERRGSA